MKTVLITSFNKTVVRLTTAKTCWGGGGSQPKVATKVDSIHRIRRRCVNVVTPVPRFNPDFWGGVVKYAVFVPPLPANLRDPRNRITASVAQVTRDMLTRVWDEMDYHIDVCHTSKGGHIEHL
jgi:hypothetical protein